LFYPVGCVLAPDPGRMAIRAAKPSPFSSPALTATSAVSPAAGVAVSSFFGLCGVAGVLDVEFLSKTVSFFFYCLHGDSP
jgi:hypothetical protein